MKKEKWVITDPSCNQKRLCLMEDRIYTFSEDRMIDVVTGKTEQYVETLDYEDYSIDDIFEACVPFGYTISEISEWITKKKEIPLMLECIFEMI